MSAGLEYEGMAPIERERAEAALVSGVPADISRALLRLALHDQDWKYAERAALAHVGQADVWVRRNAAASLGHIPRVHGQLHAEIAVPAFLRMRRLT